MQLVFHVTTESIVTLDIYLLKTMSPITKTMQPVLQITNDNIVTLDKNLPIFVSTQQPNEHN